MLAVSPPNVFMNLDRGGWYICILKEISFVYPCTISLTSSSPLLPICFAWFLSLQTVCRTFRDGFASHTILHTSVEVLEAGTWASISAATFQLAISSRTSLLFHPFNPFIQVSQTLFLFLSYFMQFALQSLLVCCRPRCMLFSSSTSRTSDTEVFYPLKRGSTRDGKRNVGEQGPVSFQNCHG